MKWSGLLHTDAGRNDPVVVADSITITPERPDSNDATLLIGELEAQLDPLYPSESRHGLSVERLLAEDVAFFLLRLEGSPACCGGVKLFDAGYGEVKRMYVRPEYRGRGLAKLMLNHLAAQTLERGVAALRLETGIHQREAIGLYERMGFYRIPPFGDYREDPLSVFFEKRLG
jgi:GNAT superfamily N-acetyltransferase